MWFTDIKLTNAAGEAAYIGIAIEAKDFVEATNMFRAWRDAVGTFTQLAVSLDMMTAKRPKGRKYIPISDTTAMRLALFEFIHPTEVK